MIVPSRPASQRGVSWVELIVSIALLTIFLLVFLERALYYQEYGEMTAMEMTVANMRTGLRYKVADLIMNNRLSEIATLADENPINWLSSRPDNYLGEYDAEPITDIAGKWYFDRTQRELVYTVNNRRHFVPGSGGDYTLRYRAMPVQAQQAAAANGSRSQKWISLVQVQEYVWLR
jgi:general secretion pathway protein G